jgi:hypothetical protein
VIDGEENIKALLNIKTIGSGDKTNCADLIGFRPNMAHAHSAVICESKGTDVEHSLVQLGNVACAMLERFKAESRPSDLLLLLYRSSSRMIEGVGESVGPKYTIGDRDRRGLYSLVHAGTDEQKSAPASPRIDMKRLDLKLQLWAERVSKLPVYVYIERRDAKA